MRLLSYNEQIAVHAQNENPFAQNKTYSPNEVLGHIITHLMCGNEPMPGNPEAAQAAKTLYTATLATLHEKNLAITEQNIVLCKDEILLAAVEVEKECLQANESETDAQVAVVQPSAATPAATLKECDSIRLEFGRKGIVLKKEWIKWGVIAIIILLIIKILK